MRRHFLQVLHRGASGPLSDLLLGYLPEEQLRLSLAAIDRAKRGASCSAKEQREEEVSCCPTQVGHTSYFTHGRAHRLHSVGELDSVTFEFLAAIAL